MESVTNHCVVLYCHRNVASTASVSLNSAAMRAVVGVLSMVRTSARGGHCTVIAPFASAVKPWASVTVRVTAVTPGPSTVSNASVFHTGV